MPYYVGGREFMTQEEMVQIAETLRSLKGYPVGRTSMESWEVPQPFHWSKSMFREALKNRGLLDD